MSAPKGNQNAHGNKGGRKSAYQPIFASICKVMSELGATQADLAAAFQVSEATLSGWKQHNHGFCEALTAGQALADAKVVKSLYHRALGYDHEETKVFCSKGDITTHEVTRYYPPDTTACIFWLKNRNPKEWQDAQVLEMKFIFDLVGKVTSVVNKTIPDTCPHCQKPLTLRESTIRELEALSANLDQSAERLS